MFVYVRCLAVIEDLRADSLKSQDALQLWSEYERLMGESQALLNQHWKKLEEILSSLTRGKNTEEHLNSRIQSINVSNTYYILAASF